MVYKTAKGTDFELVESVSVVTADTGKIFDGCLRIHKYKGIKSFLSR